MARVNMSGRNGQPIIHRFFETVRRPSATNRPMGRHSSRMWRFAQGRAISPESRESSSAAANRKCNRVSRSKIYLPRGELITRVGGFRLVHILCGNLSTRIIEPVGGQSQNRYRSRRSLDSVQTPPIQPVFWPPVGGSMFIAENWGTPN